MIHLKPNDFFHSSNSFVTTELRTPQEDFPEHYHSFEEIIIVAKGNGLHAVNDVPTCLSKNYVCFVAQQDRHLFENVNDLFLSNVLFIRDKLEPSFSLTQFLPCTLSGSVDWFIEDEAAHRVHVIIEHLNTESHVNTLASAAMTELLFQQLVVELWRGRIVDTSSLSLSDKVTQTIMYVNKNYKEKLSIERVAEHIKVPIRTLTREFKRATGMSFNHYLHFVRAQHAMQLLLNSESSITKIAFEVGYSDSNYFSTKFKQVMKKAPRQVRPLC
ncbi:helix-turn-helix domain-containing protein [Vibrio maritimus]|uniref:helix-turn-helix domain-containing protein n=1 Tax=Vibrio maritimus TaxID=990268 RepID=UPI0037351E34